MKCGKKKLEFVGAKDANSGGRCAERRTVYGGRNWLLVVGRRILSVSWRPLSWVEHAPVSHGNKTTGQSPVASYWLFTGITPLRCGDRGLSTTAAGLAALDVSSELLT